MYLHISQMFEVKCHFFSYNEHCFLRLASNIVFYNLPFSNMMFCFLLSCYWCSCMCGRENNSKPKCGVVCFFFLFYRDVEGAEPTAQSERVYRPENNCWRQRVWSPPKCSSFLQLVFQGPGEKVCLRFPSHQLLIQSVLFIGRICVAFLFSFFFFFFFFFFPFPSLSCRCVKTLVPNTGPAAIPSSPRSNECIGNWRGKRSTLVITFPPHVGQFNHISILMSRENVPWLGMF